MKDFLMLTIFTVLIPTTAWTLGHYGTFPTELEERRERVKKVFAGEVAMFGCGFLLFAISRLPL
jgi:hypothetical protein